MNSEEKKPKSSDHEAQHANNLVKENKNDEPPVSRPYSDSLKNSGRTEGFNQENIDNNNLEPSDSSDQ